MIDLGNGADTVVVNSAGGPNVVSLALSAEAGAVPEPGTLVLLGLGGIAAAAYDRRKRRLAA